jgi:FKBP-type peptidyl-prolyl cis-trans isomerase
LKLFTISGKVEKYLFKGSIFMKILGKAALCLLIMSVPLAFGACQKSAAKTDSGSAKTTADSKAADSAAPSADNQDDVSYAFGEYVGNSFKSSGLEFNYSEVMKGMQDVMEGKKTKFTEDEVMKTLNAAMQAAQKKIGDKNKAAGEKFLADNGKKSGVTTTASGLEYEVVKMGDGPKPVATDTVNEDYSGTLLDGTVFDQNKGVEFPLSGVIKGWTEGLQLMPVGSTFKFVIPSELAYGENAPSQIGPNQALIFTVTLNKIVPPAAKK